MELLNMPAKALCAAALCFGPCMASAQSLLSLHDQASGVTRVFTPDDQWDTQFLISGDGSNVDIQVNAPVPWNLRFEAPVGEKLAPGRYDDVGCRAPLRFGRAAGLEVTDNNPVCSFGLGEDTLFGSFTIRQIAYDATGNVVSLEAVFTQRLGSPTAPALGGLVRYQARPLSLQLKSQQGSVWGAVAQVHHGHTSTFEMEGTASDGLSYGAAGLKDAWRILVTPPTGQSLQKGRYLTRSTADARHAGLLILRGLDRPNPCADPHGVLHIQKIQLNPVGTILSVRARFEYRCGGLQPALRGAIRHLD